ncbi:MAG: hypothetical protein F4Y69_06240 [Chloroflexi bacterium]|nr:hypothetical protein [Chloroflexota bacterium]MYD15997.1 hypothetical protein [Chloroflexota bacterium]MYG34640.1 hypothetical protein [Gemmatimonadota bacterium]
MQGDIIPDSDHVIRYCKKGSVDRVNQALHARAFEPQDGYPMELSVNWCEELGKATWAEAVAELRNTTGAMNPEKRSGYVVLKVGAVKETLAPHSPNGVSAVHTPAPNNDSHADIVGYAADNMQAQTDLASSAAWDAVFPGKENDAFWQSG